MMKALTYPLKSFVQGTIAPGRLRWLGPWLPSPAMGWQELWREMRPRRIRRWGRVLLLAIAIVLAIGELGPSASAVLALP
ncbi:MAG: hypothetical protein PVH59_04075 [Anaerolineae bacterium]